MNTHTGNRSDKLLLLSLAATLLWSPARTAAAATAGGAPPALVGKTLAGDAFDLGARRGEVVLVDFWATWCEPCKVSLPRYAALQRKYGKDGLHIITISVDEDVAALRRFVSERAMTLPVVHDAGGKHAEKWAPEKMPTAFLIGRDGKVAWVHGGFVVSDEPKVEAAIVAALAVGKPRP